MIKLPDYAWFGKVGQCAMRRDGKFHYYRDGGDWGTSVTIVKGRIVATGHTGDFKYLNRNTLTPCTKYEWWVSNGSGQYTGKIHAARVRALNILKN